MKIKEVCTRTGLTKRAVRFYEEKGLITPAAAPNDYREFSDEDLNRLQLIAKLRALRMPVEQIGQLLANLEQAPEILAAHRCWLEEEGRQQARFSCLLAKLSSARPQTPQQLLAELERAGMEEKTAVSPDQQPDFARFEAFTAEEKAALSRQAKSNLALLERKRRRVALSLLLLLLCGLLAGWWLWREDQPHYSVSSVYGIDIRFTAFPWEQLGEHSRQIAEFELNHNPVTGKPGPFAARLPFANRTTAQLLSDSLLPGQQYAGFSVDVILSRREAKREGMLDGQGKLLTEKALERFWSDPEFALQYGSITAVYSGE